MPVTNSTNIFDNNTLLESLELTNPCPRQRNITRPLLFVHNYALFFFGSIFNFLAFIILMQRSLRRHSTFTYLAFLSLSNGLLSLVHFSKWMFKYYFNILLESFLITCRFDRFLSDFLTHFSLFTLVCVNIDRARTVTKDCPQRKYTKSRFHIVLMREFLIAGVLCAFHFHWIIKYGTEVWNGKSKMAVCSYDPNQSTTAYYYFLTTIYPPVELVVFFCLPLFVNVLCTILIVRSLSIRMRTAERFRPRKKNPVNQTTKSMSQKLLSFLLPTTTSKTNIYSCFGFQIQCRRHTRIRLKIGGTEKSLKKYNRENESFDRQILSNDVSVQTTQQSTTSVLKKIHRARRTRDIHLSAMLISLNIVYLILNLPFNLHQTFVKVFHNTNSDPCNIMFISLLLDALQQTFFMTNFFLYVLTNRRFRQELHNTISIILSNCREFCCGASPSQQRRIDHRSSLSFTTIGTIRSNSIFDNQVTCVASSHNDESVVSDMELTIASHQLSTVIINENSKINVKLVMFKEPTDV